MSRPFEYFVMFAEMRTGSNFLEENINDYPGLTCYGEVFNPHFIGHAKQSELMGMTMAQRESDPVALLDRLRNRTEGLAGFRFFNDHDPRILEHCLHDPACAKIVLTRNPVDSYVSLKIAGQTGQWRLRDMRFAKSATVDFDADEFMEHLNQLQEFQLRIQRGLQTTGQTAFYIGYDDLSDLDVLNGLASFLGVDAPKKRATMKTKVQNPSALEDKVTNFPEMTAALAKLDRFDLNRTPNFEPRRGAGLPTYVAAAKSPLMYLPVRCGVEGRIKRWLAAIDGVGEDKLLGDFHQKSVRQWKRQNRDHRTFTVVRHPVPRMYDAFQRHILATDGESYPEIRSTLTRTYKIPLPDEAPGPGFSAETMKELFLSFMGFVKGNLNQQTSVRIDPAWASQNMTLQGMAQFAVPDYVLRAEDLALGLGQLCVQLSLDPKELPKDRDNSVIALGDIYDEDVEAAVRAACQRDYMVFGYGPWRR